MPGSRVDGYADRLIYDQKMLVFIYDGEGLVGSDEFRLVLRLRQFHPNLGAGKNRVGRSCLDFTVHGHCSGTNKALCSASAEVFDPLGEADIEAAFFLWSFKMEQ